MSRSIWGDDPVTGNLMGTNVGAWTETLIRLGAKSPKSLLAAKDSILGHYRTVFGHDGGTVSDITDKLKKFGSLPFNNVTLHMALTEPGVGENIDSHDVSYPRLTLWDMRDDATKRIDAVSALMADAVFERGVDLRALIDIPDQTTANELIDFYKLTVTKPIPLPHLAPPHEPPAFMRPVMIDISAPPTPDTGYVISPYEGAIEKIYSAHQAPSDRDHIAASTADHVWLHPPSSCSVTAHPRALPRDMQPIRHEWLSKVYALHIDYVCIPAIIRLYHRYLNTFRAASDETVDNGDLDRVWQLLVEISTVRHEQLIRKHVIATLADDVASRSFVFTHPITLDELRYWIMRSLESECAASAYSGTDDAPKAISVMHQLSRAHVIAPSAICDTLMAFECHVTPEWVDEVYAEWSELYTRTSNAVAVGRARQWFDEFKATASARSIMLQAGALPAPMSVHLTQIHNLCMWRYAIWATEWKRDASLSAKHTAEVQDFWDAYDGQPLEEKLERANTRSFITRVWLAVFAPVPNYVRVIEAETAGALAHLGKFDPALDARISYCGDDVVDYVNACNVCYRDYVARYNWHEQFYASWAVESDTKLFDTTSYVARLDNLELRSVEHTAKTIGVPVQDDKLFDIPNIIACQLTIPVKHWPVHRRWKTLRVRWEYYVTMGDGDSDTPPADEPKTIEYSMFGIMVPHIHVLCSCLLDDPTLKDPTHRHETFIVRVTCTLSGDYYISKQVPDVTNNVAVTCKFQIQCRYPQDATL